jgi:hypothetical protein
MKILNKKIKTAIFMTIILIVAGYIAVATYKSHQSDIEPISEESIQGKVFYIIDYGEQNSHQYWVDFFENSTVFSLLEKLAEKENFEIEFSFYPEMGVFVKSIGQAEGGTDNKWWQYWINGNLGEVAADKKKLKSDDVIEWKFEVPPSE